MYDCFVKCFQQRTFSNKCKCLYVCLYNKISSAITVPVHFKFGLHGTTLCRLLPAVMVLCKYGK